MTLAVSRAAIGALAWLAAAQAIQATQPAHAVEVQSLDVTRDGPHYSVDLQVRLNAGADAAYAVMNDYGNLPAINPSVTSVSLTEGAAAPSQRVRAQVRVCIAFFCRTLDQVQDMHATPAPEGGGAIHADVIPELSNLDSGVADWKIWPCPASLPATPDQPSSCLRFTATLDPGFWVPPIIGPIVIRSKLREEALETSAGIERAAAAND